MLTGFLYHWTCFSEAYSEPCQTSKIAYFEKISNGIQSLTIFTKSSILNVWQGSKYTFVLDLRVTNPCYICSQSLNKFVIIPKINNKNYLILLKYHIKFICFPVMKPDVWSLTLTASIFRCQYEINIWTGKKQAKGLVREAYPQLTFTSSKSSIETLEKGVKYVQN